MKVTFINPPQTNSKYKFLGVVAPSLGIGYIAAVLENNGFDVDVLDASALDLTYDEIGDEILPNFHVYFGDVWIQIKENKSYMFISSPNHEEFISDVIKNIIQSKIENLEKEITMEKIDLKDCFADIIALDAIKVSGSWFKKINPQDQSAYLNGTLIDEEGRESALYSKLKESAKQQSSITITSRKLVNTINFSESKISSRNKEVTNISLIDYFNKIVYPLISQ